MTVNGLRLALLLACFSLLITPLLSANEFLLAQADGGGKPKLVDFWQPGDPGQRMNIRGRVTSLSGAPVPGATIYIRQANGDGVYTQRYSGSLTTDEQGRYQFASVVPGQYYSAKHVHLSVASPGFQSRQTEILFQGDPNLDDPDAPNAIFLEESTVNGETILFGRFDISLSPL